MEDKKGDKVGDRSFEGAIHLYSQKRLHPSVNSSTMSNVCSPWDSYAFDQNTSSVALLINNKKP